MRSVRCRSKGPCSLRTLVGQDQGGTAMRLIHLTICGGLCGIPLGALAAAFHDEPMPHSSQWTTPSPVEGSTKGNRTLTPFNVGVPGVSVEISGQLNFAITVRDSRGNMIYQVDPANRLTIVAKRTGRIPEFSATQKMPAISLPLPEGCEGAFSPYAAPDRAHIIGRCIS
jgi:hypothetical protein